MKNKLVLVIVSLVLVLGMALSACGTNAPPPTPPPDSQQQMEEATKRLSDEARNDTNLSEGAFEPRAVAERIKRTNLPNHVGYIYFVSPFDGNVIMKATFVGKPTSTTKRIDPPEKYDQVSADLGEFNGDVFLEYSAVGADGTWGSSTDGIFWFDTSGQMMETRGLNAALIMILERPYVFAGNKIDLSIDPRVQTDQVDVILEAQAEAVEKYLTDNPNWQPGDVIPLEVLKNAGN